MAKRNYPQAYLYVVDRDFGFAPNPFHGFCTLATCKPDIRNTAKVGDWIFGLGGKRLKASGRCIFAMKVTSKVTFNEYWNNPDFRDKKPIRNGSRVMMVGDNIYVQDPSNNTWQQARSHHSKPDGSLNEHNLRRDTRSKFVLISKHFYYFGSSAPTIPEIVLQELRYRNGVGHRVYKFDDAKNLLKWMEVEHKDSLNLVVGDPFDFDQSERNYSVKNNRIT